MAKQSAPAAPQAPQGHPVPQEALQQGHSLSMEDAASDELGQFDGQTFLSDNGLTLVGAGKNEGEVNVTDSYGNPATINMKQVLGQSGLNPMEYNINMNSPDTAVNTSPVGFGDRIRLALGNAKGQIEYLKANYQDAQLKDGDLYVKDKGVWHTVDARGLGDGNGWDVAKELGGDIVDFTKDAIMGAGQIAGATLGGAAGAAAGGIGAIPGSIAGATAGAAIASAGTAALGRILGTYDATPEEMVKDVGMDTVLGMAGEGIPLGAKAAIVPALQRAFAKLGSAEVAGPVKSMIAGLWKSTAGIAEHDSMTALNNPTAVSTKVAKYIEEAKLPQHLNDTGNIFDAPLESGFAPGSDEAIAAVARRDMLGAVKTVVGDAKGSGSAQANLSRGYRGIIEDVATAVPDQQDIAIKPALSEHWQDLTNRFQKAGILEDGSVTKLVNANDLGAQLGITPQKALRLKATMEDYLGGLANKTTSDIQQKGPDGMRALFDTVKGYNDVYHELVASNPDMKMLLDGTSGKLQNSLRQAANFEVDMGGGMVNGSKLIADANQWYATRKPIVQAAMDAAERGTAGYEAMANQFLADPEKKLAAKQSFAYLAELLPTKQQGQAALDAINVASSAQAFARSVPKGAIGATVPRIGAAGLATAVAGPLAGAATIGITSPRAVLKSATSATKGLSMLGSTIRNMPSKTRSAMLASPENFGAMLAASTGNLYDPTK